MVTVDNAVPPTPEGKSIFEESWFWASIIIFVVIAITVFLVLILRKKKKGEETSAESRPEERTQSRFRMK
jgi:large-conductance mechanosensitive channel